MGCLMNVCETCTFIFARLLDLKITCTDRSVQFKRLPKRSFVNRNVVWSFGRHHLIDYWQNMRHFDVPGEKTMPCCQALMQCCPRQPAVYQTLRSCNFGHAIVKHKPSVNKAYWSALAAGHGSSSCQIRPTCSRASSLAMPADCAQILAHVFVGGNPNV